MSWHDPLAKPFPRMKKALRLGITWTVYIALALLMLHSLFGCVPDARAATLDEVSAELVDDSLRVTVGYQVDTRADSGVVKVTIGSASQSKRVAAGPGSQAFMFAAPAEGATITIAAQVTAYKTGTPPVSVGKNRTWTRPVGPLEPPVIDTIDVGEVARAIGEARVVDSTEIVRITGETCRIERRDYYGRELLILLDSAATAAGCEAAVLRVVDDPTPAASILSYNAAQVRTADSLYASAPAHRQAYLDSVKAGLDPGGPLVSKVAELPRTLLDTWRGDVAMGPDTLVTRQKGASGPELVTIAEARAADPGFTWP